MISSPPPTSVKTRLSPPSSASTITMTTAENNNSNTVSSNSVNLVSTLVKVTEQFLYTVNQLETSSQPMDQLFQSVLEHYDRLNMVIRVLKIACPIALEQIDNNEARSILSTTAENASITAFNTMNRIKHQFSSPSETTTAATVLHKMVVIPSSPLLNQNQVTQEQEWKKELLSIDQSIQSPSTQEQSPNTDTMSEIEATTMDENNSNKLLTINSNQFVDQFENTCNAFAKQNHIDFKDCWESLLKIALPQDKLPWAESFVFNKSLDWSTVKKMYLAQYPTIHNKPILRQFNNNNNQQQQQKKKKLTQRVNIVTQPINSPNINDFKDESEKKQALARQMKYAESLLSLEMKDDESIDEYNAKYKRYAQAACMDLNKPHLFKRYVASLLPKNREWVQNVLSKNAQMQPKSLEEMMKLVKNSVMSQQQSQQCVYAAAMGKACWKQCNSSPSWTNNNNNNDNGLKRPTSSTKYDENRPLKRYSSFYA